MKPKTCICKKCGNTNMYYEIPTNLILKTLSLHIYWCHKCEARNYFWDWKNTGVPVRPVRLR